MKQSIVHALCLLLLAIGVSSCHTSAPRLNYQSLARASLKLGMDIERTDNHQLYIQAAEWIGTPYRAGGTSKRGTDCSGLVAQLYKKSLPHTFATQHFQPTGRKPESVTTQFARGRPCIFHQSHLAQKSGSCRHLSEKRQVYSCQHQSWGNRKQSERRLLFPTLASGRKNKVNHLPVSVRISAFPHVPVCYD